MKTNKFGQNGWEEETEECDWEEVYEMNRIEAFLEEGDREIERLNKEIDEHVDELARQKKFVNAQEVEVAEVG